MIQRLAFSVALVAVTPVLLILVVVRSVYRGNLQTYTNYY